MTTAESAETDRSQAGQLYLRAERPATQGRVEWAARAAALIVGPGFRTCKTGVLKASGIEHAMLLAKWLSCLHPITICGNMRHGQQW